MAKKSAKQAKLDRELEDLAVIVTALPLNPIPWVAALKLIAPVLVRLAIRQALKRVKRGMAEDKVKSVTDSVTGALNALLDARLPPAGGSTP